MFVQFSEVHFPPCYDVHVKMTLTTHVLLYLKNEEAISNLSHTTGHTERLNY